MEALHAGISPRMNNKFRKFFKIYRFHSNRMDKQAISIEPEIIHFASDSTQLIKVINRSNETIDNCFFCLFNTNKFQFSPDTFSLQPREHKLITLTMKLKLSESGGKEFAYLKSKSYNKRLTLITTRKDSGSAEKTKNLNEGLNDLNTLSSRDYKDAQKTGYEKIIQEKQAYIANLQRKLADRQKQQSNKIYLDQISKLEFNNQVLRRQKQQLVLQITKLKISSQSESKTSLLLKLQQAQRQLTSQSEQIKFLEIQCQQFLHKVQEKEIAMKELQYTYVGKIDGIIKEGEKKLQELQARLQEEIRNSDRYLKETKITEKLERKYQQIEEQLAKKDKELQNISEKLDEEKHLNRKLNSESKRALKSAAESEALLVENRDLKEQLDSMMRTNRELKEETSSHKKKMSDHETSVSKVQQYLQMAIESCKSENQILKKGKEQAQKQLSEQSKTKRFFENKVQSLQQNLRDCQFKLKQCQQQKQKIIRQQSAEREENHDKIMQLKSENIQLIEKISTDSRKTGEAEDKIGEFRRRAEESQKAQEKLHQQYMKLTEQYKEVFQEKEKVQKKIEKYRREAKKSIKTISNNAKDELKRIQEQKKQLEKKVEQLEISAKQIESSVNENRNKKTMTHHEDMKKTKLLDKPTLSNGDLERRVGIRSQKKMLEESEIQSPSSDIDMDRVYTELGHLRQYKNYVGNEIKKLQTKLGIFDSYDNPTTNPIFHAINFFKDLQQKICDHQSNCSSMIDVTKQNQYLKGRLAQIQPILKQFRENQEKLREKKEKKRTEENHPMLPAVPKLEVDVSALEYVRIEMKNQYKKLYDALKLSEDKYAILRKKIYEEYRSRIIELLSKKDRDEYTITKIQALLERFVDGLGNTSHKEALLAKQVKLKQEARREASVMKEKVNVLSKQMEEVSKKKGTACIREIKMPQFANENDWIDSIKMEAKMLTFEAENAKLEVEKDLINDKMVEALDQLKLCESDLQIKQEEIERLKKEVIEITKEYTTQCEFMEQELETYKKKFANMQKMQKKLADLQVTQKQNNHLRDELQQKRDLIRTLKEREKMLEQLLDESKKNESAYKQRERKDLTQESRMQESLKDLKQNNRELRTQNSRLKDQIEELAQDLNKKNVAIKRLKSETEEYRMRNSKAEGESMEKMKSEIGSLKTQLRKLKDQNDKIKRKKQQEISELQAEISKAKSQFLIERSSLESVSRALVDTMRGVYCSLDIVVRKKGSPVQEQPNFDALAQNPTQIRTTKLRKYFDEVIDKLKQ